MNPMKQCTKCKKVKDLSDFNKQKTCKDGLTYNCKECCSKDYKKRYKINREKILSKQKGKYNEYFKNRYKNKTEEEKEKQREYLRNWNKKEENKIKNRKYKKEIFRKKPRNKILIHLRKRIRDFIKNQILNDSKYIEILGCSPEYYKQYLEDQFTSEMNWDNYGIYWEIDHKKSISKFKGDFDELKKAFHYTNTQPLTVTENRKKSNKY